MTYDADVTTRERAPLTRSRIIETAVAFADEFGVDALSMRKLGAELNVEAMSLYNHVGNKDDIYDGMVDYVFASIPLPEPDVSWQESIRSIGVAGMDTFAAHNWVVTLLMLRGNFGPSSLRFTDRVIGILTEAGFTDEDAHHAWQMLASHTMGYAFQAGANPTGMNMEHLDVEATLAAASDRFPNVARLAPLLASCEYGSEYAFGLEIIIDGLEARLSASN
ncbi:MAG: TetR/AcrR family transcriptional regulator C-terminal domain-containing protein [Acidimicrobiia bacterium]|nr:MAG: TetR/AcrR family transcriptional regulator C-terminal domain-containing protein [Acidimicrobiia bacterium]